MAESNSTSMALRKGPRGHASEAVLRFPRKRHVRSVVCIMFGLTFQGRGDRHGAFRGSAEGLCVLVLERAHAGSERWEAAARMTWANEDTFFIRLVSRPASRVALSSARDLRPQNRSVPQMGHVLELGGLESTKFATWERGLELWTRLASHLGDFSLTNNSVSPLHLGQCRWFMHVGTSSYVNMGRLGARLRCLRNLRPEYYALAPMTNGAGLAIADELGGYLIGRSLLLESGVSWVKECRQLLVDSGDALGFGWNHLPGFYVTLCLWELRRLQLQRLADPTQEVVVPIDAHTGTDKSGPSEMVRVRALTPSGHCILLASCRSPRSFMELHRIQNDPVNSLQVGCWVHSFVDYSVLNPPWSGRVARAIAKCPLREALRIDDLRRAASPWPDKRLSLAALLAEWRRPSRPHGAAADTLRSTAQRRGRWRLCVLMPFTDTAAKHVGGARAVAETWAAPYLPNDDSRYRRGDEKVVALMYGRRPLLREMADATFSLPGDLDLRHPKFNALRFLYLWRVLARFHQRDCDFFMKADMDAYVNVPAILRALRRFNASDPVYVGQVTHSHGPGYKGWEPFAHGLGYTLSRGALRVAGAALDDCFGYVVRFRLETIEDMCLASCLRNAGVRPEEIEPFIFNFKGDVVRSLAEVPEPLIVHPVWPADMHALHAALEASTSQP